MTLIALWVVLLMLVLALLPGWPYSTRWNYYPSVSCGLIAVALAWLVVVGVL